MAEGKDKQAVLVIHGIGEQRPMLTLRGFVDAVWTSNESVHHKYGASTVWSKPDTISGSYELRRLTTGKNKKDKRTDFFELYWAHRMHGTTWSHVLAWAKTLLLRRPWTLPPRLRPAWALLVGLGLVVAFFALQAALPEEARWIPWPRWASGAVSIFTALILAPVMKNVVGDAARYLDAAPPNIKRRQEIRSHGVEILKKLHEAGYERIVVVGHSLGAVIGYDVLTHAWAYYNEQPKLEERKTLRGKHAALDAVEELTRGARDNDYLDDLDEWREAQRKYLEELWSIGCPWRVTDFVTLGNPLTHAEVLLAKDREDLRRCQVARELPTCPPALDGDKFSYPTDRQNRIPHHGAVFAPTRWTNLYFPSRFILHGDFIGGPVAPIFGPGVRDVPVSTTRRGGWFSHTLYWRRAKSLEEGLTEDHIKELRFAVNLLDDEELERESAEAIERKVMARIPRPEFWDGPERS